MKMLLPIFLNRQVSSSPRLKFFSDQRPEPEPSRRIDGCVACPSSRDATETRSENGVLRMVPKKVGNGIFSGLLGSPDSWARLVLVVRGVLCGRSVVQCVN